MHGEHYFDALRTGQVEPAGWLLTPTLEDRSLSARRQDGQTMILVAGRQLTTREGLEVLAIGTRTPLADGLPLDETLARIRAADAVPVLPWGSASGGASEGLSWIACSNATTSRSASVTTAAACSTGCRRGHSGGRRSAASRCSPAPTRSPVGRDQQARSLRLRARRARSRAAGDISETKIAYAPFSTLSVWPARVALALLP